MRRQSESSLTHRLLPALILFGLACSRSEDTTVSEQGPHTDTIHAATLRDGLYPVLWEAMSRDSASLVAFGQVVLPYDRKYSGSPTSEPRTYVAIDTTSSVPLILEGQPEARHDGTGHALLSVTLARDYTDALESFTTEHLGEGVAILLDGEVVTMHKLRSIIREGKLQITRCDDNSCEILRAKLTN